MIALSSGSLHTYGLARVFELAAEAGFDGVEVLIDHRWDSRQPAYLDRLRREYGLRIVALHSPFAFDVPGWPHDQLGRLESTVALARELGVPVVVTHLPYRICGLIGHWYAPRPRRVLLPVFWIRREPYYYFLRDGLLEQLEAESGVVIAVENEPRRRAMGIKVALHWFSDLDDLLRFAHLALDTAHLGMEGQDLIAAYERLKGRVVHVHLANCDDGSRLSPPDGELPLAEFLSHLAADGFNGAISIESVPQALDAHDEDRCRAALTRALHFCRQYFRVSAHE